MNNKSKNIIIFILVVIILIISYFLVFKDLFKDRYSKMEDNLISLAKDYINSNNITINKEIYLDSIKLKYNLDDDCNKTSGVIYDGSNYIVNLVCKEYKSNVIKTNNEIKEYITLKGDEVIILAKGMKYYEPGFITNDMVTTVGEVGTEEGVYTINYKLKNSNNMAVRKVIIIDNQEIRNLFPTIILNGDEVVYIVEGNNFTDEKVSAYDNIDGNITNNVKIDNTIDTNKIGEYKIIYTITNSRGYSNSITRKVNVISSESDLNVDYTLSQESMTNEEVIIKLSVSDEFNKIVYPDNSEGENLTYTVNESGTYKFIIYDKYNRQIIKEIEITNIDKTIPQGTCTATLYYNKTEVVVNITTSREISSYEYFIDNVSSKELQTNTYTNSKVNPTNIKVKVKDSINNQNEITCTKVNKLTRNIVTNEKGKNCLEGMTCYLQGEWGSRNYPYCSMADKKDGSPNNTCNGIPGSGCSITSATNAIAAMGIKSKNGELYNPWTVYDELYPVNKKTGKCGGGCSGWERIRDAIVAAGLTAPKTITRLKQDTLHMITDNLKKGYPVIIHANGHPYSKSKGHYLTIIGIREDGYIFVTDSDNTQGINKATYNGKQYYVDTWIDPQDLITGNIDEFLLVGAPGVYEGKLR